MLHHPRSAQVVLLCISFLEKSLIHKPLSSNFVPNADAAPKLYTAHERNKLAFDRILSRRCHLSLTPPHTCYYRSDSCHSYTLDKNLGYTDLHCLACTGFAATVPSHDFLIRCETLDFVHAIVHRYSHSDRPPARPSGTRSSGMRRMLQPWRPSRSPQAPGVIVRGRRSAGPSLRQHCRHVGGPPGVKASRTSLSSCS